MIEIIKALLTGALVGFIFGFMKLPVPAPQVPAGVAGVVGLYLGYLLFSRLQK